MSIDLALRGFLRRGSIIAIGVSVSQGIGLASLPVLTRLFSSSDLGSFGSFYLGAQFLSTVLALRYEQAIFLSKPGQERARTIGVCILASVLSAAVLFLCALGAWSLGAVGIDFAAVTLLCGLLSSLSTTLSVVAINSDKYFLVAASRIARASVAIGTQVALSVGFGLGLSALVWGETIAVGVCFGILLAGLFAELKHSISQSNRWAIKAIAWRFRDQPLWNLPQTTINGISRWFAVLIITGMYSVHDAGQFYLMQRILLAPSVLIGGAVSQVYFRDAAERRRNVGNFWGVFWPLSIAIGSIGICLSVAVWRYGEPLFTLLLGPGWSEAGLMSEVYAPYMLVHVVLSVLGPTALIAERQRALMFVTIVQTLAFLVPLAVSSHLSGGLIAALRVTVAVSVPVMVGIYFWYARLALFEGGRVER